MSEKLSAGIFAHPSCKVPIEDFYDMKAGSEYCTEREAGFAAAKCTGGVDGEKQPFSEK